MSAELQATESDSPPSHPTREHEAINDAEADTSGSVDEEEDDQEEEDEPKLKYTKLTGSLTNVYRNGDSTSAFVVAGDKMVLGTHNGNIHVLGLPSMQSLRTFHAHQATVTAVSVSPVPPPPTVAVSRRAEGRDKSTTSPPPSFQNQTTAASSLRNTQRPSQLVPNTSRNQIYIATSSLDGHVCISSLVDLKDSQRRNFARPVNAVALSPDYKNDRTYLSGGLAGQLILTEGGRTGVTIDANTNSAAAAASGWLGTFGLAADRGKDTALHSGEGAISAIKWSLSSKWVVWVNEEGIKIMRSHLKLGSENSEDAWTRIAHAAKPNREAWEGMAGVWKGRCEWVDESKLEHDSADQQTTQTNGTGVAQRNTTKRKKTIETLVVGWGDTAWLLHVYEGGTSSSGKREVGTADIIHKMQFGDCVISGISLYTPELLAILAWRTRDDDDEPIQQVQSKPKTARKGRSHRHTGLAPQLRLVHTATGEEVDLDELTMSRFEMLSAQDYHLGTLYIPPAPAPKVSDQRGALEGLFDAAGGKYATRMFSSSASVLSAGSSGAGDVEGNGRIGTMKSPQSSVTGVASSLPSVRRPTAADAHPYASSPGLKLFIHSPYDCVLAVRRDLSNHLEWLLENKQYANAWDLIDRHPEIIDNSAAGQTSLASAPSSPRNTAGGDGGLAEFFADETSASGLSGPHAKVNNVRSERMRIGDLWLQQLVDADQWAEAGRVAGKVLDTSSRWEHWVLTFAHADKFDEITPYIPLTQVPPLSSLVYELVLGHYIEADPLRLRQLVEECDLDNFDAGSVVAAIESRLESEKVTEQTVEDGVRGRDWKILTEILARLYLAEGRARDALRCYIRAQDAEAALRLIRDEKMVDAITDDVAGLLMLRVDRETMRHTPLNELREATSEALQILIEEAHRGTVPTTTVVRQLLRKGDEYRPFLFLYLQALWNKNPKDTAESRWNRNLQFEERHALVDQHADLAVELFSEYDRELLDTFLRSSSEYSFDKAIDLCRKRNFVPELVHVLEKTGQTKRALFLIIDEIGDVEKAISFTKDNPDLWDDLLEYSMSRPLFIRGLLAEVGTAIDPIQLIKRIPDQMEIEGLRDAVAKMMREYDIQHSIAEGAAKVLRSEVATDMDILRAGRRKGVRFDIVQESEKTLEPTTHDTPTEKAADKAENPPTAVNRKPDTHTIKSIPPGHCAGCGEMFHEQEYEALLGFACGHIAHLSCLLRASGNADEKEIERLRQQLGYSAPSVEEDFADLGGSADDDFAAYGTRSVGAKVAHAHIIRGVVERSGCPVCK